MWRDKNVNKPIIAVSTYVKKEKVVVTNKHGKVTEKLRMIQEKNNSMNGSGIRNQMISYKKKKKNGKKVKWWKQMFALSFEVTLVNYFIFTLHDQR